MNGGRREPGQAFTRTGDRRILAGVLVARGTAGWALGVSLLACSPERLQLTLPAPEPDQHALLVALVSGDRRELRAVDLDASTPTVLPALGLELERADIAELAAFYYRETLASLGITAGAVELAGEEGRLLPDPAARWFARVDAVLHDWTQSTETPASLAALRIPAKREVCLDLTWERQELEGTELLLSLGAIGGDVVVGLEGGSILRVPRGERPRELARAGSPAATAMYTDPRGGVWIGTADRRLLFLDPVSEALEERAANAFPDRPLTLIGAPGTEQRALFAVGDRSFLTRWTSSTSTVIGERVRLESRVQPHDWRLSAESQSAIWVAEGGSSVWYVTDTAATKTRLPWPAVIAGPKHLTMLTELQGRRVAIGFAESGTGVRLGAILFEQISGDWQVHEEEQPFKIGWYVRAAAVVGDVLLLGGERGTVAQYRATGGFCVDSQITAGGYHFTLGLATGPKTAVFAGWPERGLAPPMILWVSLP